MARPTPHEQIAIIYTVLEIHPRDSEQLAVRSVHIAARSSAEAERLWGAHIARLQLPRPRAYILTDASRDRQDPGALAVMYPGRIEEIVSPAELDRWEEVQTRGFYLDGERIPAAFRAIPAATTIAEEGAA